MQPGSLDPGCFFSGSPRQLRSKVDRFSKGDGKQLAEGAYSVSVTKFIRA